MSFFAARLVVFSMIVMALHLGVGLHVGQPLVRLDHTVRVVVRRLGFGLGLRGLGITRSALMRPRLVTSRVRQLEDFIEAPRLRLQRREGSSILDG